MAEYSFITVWKLEAPIEEVWHAIYYSQHWPQWWDYVEDVVERTEGDDLGVGSIRHYTWKTRLGYKLTFDIETIRVEPPYLLEGKAVGELNGEGVWRLSENKPLTTVQYNWNVSTDKLWMNLFAPIARSFFKWNHDEVMRKGGEGLAKLLNCKLVRKK